MLSDILPTGYEVGVLNGQVQLGDVVAVVGAGPIGLAAIMGARMFSPSHVASSLDALVAPSDRLIWRSVPTLASTPVVTERGRPKPKSELAGRLGPVLDKIRGRGGRVTWPRIAILEALMEGNHHITVEDLEHRLKITAPEVHQATFYRTLAALEDLGVIYHLHLGHGPSVWHLVVDEHEHLVCSRCGAVTEVGVGEFDALRSSIADRFGFVLDTRHFVSQGLCGICATSGPSEERSAH